MEQSNAMLFGKHHQLKHYSNTIDNSTKKDAIVIPNSQIQIKGKLKNPNLISKNPNGMVTLTVDNHE